MGSSVAGVHQVVEAHGIVAAAAGAEGHGVDGASVAWYLLLAVLLLAANGFFVAYEFAILAARRSAFEHRVESGSRVAKAALESFGDLSLQLAGAQLGITVASLALGYVGEPALAVLIEAGLGVVVADQVALVLSFVIALAIVTFLHLVFGEMVPKNLAISAPELAMSWLVLPYRAYLWLVRPLVLFLNWLAAVGCRVLGVEVRDELVSSLSVSELASIVAAAVHEGAIDGDEVELVHGALEFARKPVSEVASPLADIATIRFGASADQAERVIVASGQTRVPISSPSRGQERLVGYLHAKDLLDIDPADRFTPIPESRHRTMAVVREDRPVIEALRQMRRLRRQLAVVVGEGQPVGVVSVEQIIRALVESNTVRDV